MGRKNANRQRAVRPHLEPEVQKVRNKAHKPSEQRFVEPKTSSGCPLRIFPDSSWSPSPFTAFKALLSARLCAAVWSLISDCDETFNYWEPTHLMIYGSGFQTWEYSPVYALRSYFYILIHSLPGSLYANVFYTNKVLVFCFIRCILAFAAAASEAYFYKAINTRFGGSVARLMLAISLFACGMFISSAAYLPSSFSMYFTMLAFGAWLLKNHAISIVCIAASTFIGWPFASILGSTIAVDLLVYQRKVSLFVKWSVASIVLILVPLVLIDSHYYGKLVVAPLNIVSYNVFSSSGPDLYGTEPWTFYFVNGFLNFNFVFVAALSVGPVLGCVSLAFNDSRVDTKTNRIAWFLVLPMYLWIAIFFTRAHKEERFLFPVYPLFSFCGAFALDTFEKIILRFIKWNRFINAMRLAFVAICTVLALSRSLALYQGYQAPFEVFMEVNRIEQEMKPHHAINLCVGKEWHRFPSSFFLPDKWNLQFIQSEFRGQLPQPFSSFPNATSAVPENMNEFNLEENSRYLDIKFCHYLVDLDVPAESPREPRYSNNNIEWEIVFTSKFLDTARSPHLLRSFYVPSLTEASCHYAHYNLLRSREMKVKWLNKAR